MMSSSSTRATTNSVSDTVSHALDRSFCCCPRMIPKTRTPSDAVPKILVITSRCCKNDDVAGPDGPRAGHDRDGDRPDGEDNEGDVEPEHQPLDSRHDAILVVGRMRASTHTIPWHHGPGDRQMQQAVPAGRGPCGAAG